MARLYVCLRMILHQFCAQDKLTYIIVQATAARVIIHLEFGMEEQKSLLVWVRFYHKLYTMICPRASVLKI
jgi:hypothetical protein